jgi:glycosyltransferase involved in cell wall biosynthesis
VHFAGFVDDKAEVRERLRRCTVFALPSRFEGLPVALLEAMSCGAPAVGTSIPAIAEVIEDGVSGRLVHLEDPPALAEAIAAVASDRERYSAAARERIERRFSIDRLGRDLHAAIRGATRGG